MATSTFLMLDKQYQYASSPICLEVMLSLGPRHVDHHRHATCMQCVTLHGIASEVLHRSHDYRYVIVSGAAQLRNSLMGACGCAGLQRLRPIVHGRIVLDEQDVASAFTHICSMSVA